VVTVDRKELNLSKNTEKGLENAEEVDNKY